MPPKKKPAPSMVPKKNLEFEKSDAGCKVTDVGEAIENILFYVDKLQKKNSLALSHDNVKMVAVGLGLVDDHSEGDIIL
jgi:hypothetical protein